MILSIEFDRSRHWISSGSGTAVSFVCALEWGHVLFCSASRRDNSGVNYPSKTCLALTLSMMRVALPGRTRVGSITTVPSRPVVTCTAVCWPGYKVTWKKILTWFSLQSASRESVLGGMMGSFTDVGRRAALWSRTSLIFVTSAPWTR